MLATRKSIKVLLLNNKNELLMLYTDDPKTTASDGTYHGPFWQMIGGSLEADETLEDAALREIYEETGIPATEITLGPIVWIGEFELVLSGTHTLLKQQFIVAHTTKQNVNLENLTDAEKMVIKKIAWLSLEQMAKCKYIIYPIGITEYLPNILAGKYPKEPIPINLARKPNS
ncbi:MAG: NUDIX domain-containing protein [Epsilonproteobacteria bacterium]|nr:NUDIX domain-containing protein [Campylobacterota bacterium]